MNPISLRVVGRILQPSSVRNNRKQINASRAAAFRRGAHFSASLQNASDAKQPEAPRGKNFQWFKNFFSSDSSKNRSEGPVAKTVATSRTVHGVQLTDDYAWMEDLDSKDTKRYIDMENSYAKKKLFVFKSSMDIFYDEIRDRIVETEDSIPEPIGPYRYYSRMIAHSDFQIYLRRKIFPPDSPEEIILDGNLVALEHEYLFISTIKMSHDHKTMAYIVDTTGTETFRVIIKNLDTGDELQDEIIEDVVNAEWLKDGKTLLYTVADDKKRPWRVFSHKLGTPTTMDKMIYEEKDDRYFLDIVRSKDWNYLFINANSKTSAEIILVDSVEPTNPLRKIISRDTPAEYYLEHAHGKFYIVTNDGGVPNYQMYRVDVANVTDRSAWELFVPARDDVVIEDVDLFHDHIVMYEKHRGLPKIRVIQIATGKSHYVDFPQPVGHLQPGTNLDFNAITLRFVWSSPIHPDCVYDYNLNSRELKKLKQSSVPGLHAWNPAHYVCEVKWVDNDGVQVPLTMYRHVSVAQNGENPVLLSGYGAYGTSHEPTFKPENLSLLQRGWILAVCHARGGGDLGRKWYEAGKALNKKNTFSDFVACAQWLVDQNWTNSEMMCAKAASAGGLLLAYIANEHPKLFKAMILKVPFVDVLTSMLDTSLPLTVHEFDEWGDPSSSKQVFDYMLSYDPYRNIKRQEYPHMLLTASTLDIRVPCWQPLKYIAKLRKHKLDNNMLVINIDSNSGHFGAGGRNGLSREAASDYAFLYQALGYRPKHLPIEKIEPIDVKIEKAT